MQTLGYLMLAIPFLLVGGWMVYDGGLRALAFVVVIMGGLAAWYLLAMYFIGGCVVPWGL